MANPSRRIRTRSVKWDHSMNQGTPRPAVPKTESLQNCKQLWFQLATREKESNGDKQLSLHKWMSRLQKGLPGQIDHPWLDSQSQLHSRVHRKKARHGLDTRTRENHADVFFFLLYSQLIVQLLPLNCKKTLHLFWWCFWAYLSNWFHPWQKAKLNTLLFIFFKIRQLRISSSKFSGNGVF